MIHFVAHRGASRRGLKLGAAFGILCLVAAIAATVFAPPGPTSRVVKMVPSMLFMLGFLGFAAGASSGMVPRTVEVEVRDGMLRLLDAPNERWSPRGAVIGPLHGQHGAGSGTVVHLLDGPRVLRVGAMGTRTIDAAQATAPPVMLADVYVAPAELEAIRAWAQQPALTAPGGVSRFRLVQNPLLLRSIGMMVLPFVGGIALAALVAQVLPEEFLHSQVGQGLFGFGTLFLVGGLVVWTHLRRAKVSTSLLVEVSPAGLRILDASGANALGPMAPGALTISRAMHTYSTRSGTFQYPSVTVGWPGQRPLTIGVVGLHLRWADVNGQSAAPRHVLGLPDFIALVDALGLRQYLLGA